jgi:hypothetical protein
MLHFAVYFIKLHYFSTLRDIKDFVSQSHGAKFRSVKNRSTICIIIHDITSGK